MKRQAVLGDRVFWFDDAKQPHPAVVTTVLVEASTGEHKEALVLTIFGRYNVESGVIVRTKGRAPDQWDFEIA